MLKRVKLVLYLGRVDQSKQFDANILLEDIPRLSVPCGSTQTLEVLVNVSDYEPSELITAPQ